MKHTINSIPFSPPYIDDDIIAAVEETLRSGWITSGPKVKELEAKLAVYVGVEQVLCVNSGTNGLILALKWLGIGPGDEVIVPAYTYAATAIAVMQAGAKPILVDVQDDFCISMQEVEQAITSKTKAIIPVDFGGMPCQYTELYKLVNQPDIKNKFSPGHLFQEKLGRIAIIADAAHSIGASYQQNKTGSLADMSVFSFHAVKNITAAEGGAICLNLPSSINNYNTYKELKVYALNGQTKDAFTKQKGSAWQYDIQYAGIKANMPDICAAIAIAQLKKYEPILLPKRRALFKYYNQLLAQFDWAILPKAEDEKRQSSCHVYSLRIDGITEQQRNMLMEFLSNEGIHTNVHFIPLPMLTLFKEQGYQMADFPKSWELYQNEISLPIYPNLHEKQLSFIVKTLSRAYQKLMFNQALEQVKPNEQTSI